MFLFSRIEQNCVYTITQKVSLIVTNHILYKIQVLVKACKAKIDIIWTQDGGL